MNQIKKLEALLSGIENYMEELYDATVALKKVIAEVENTLEDIRCEDHKQQRREED